jgi:GxxExxY protein
MDDDFEGLVEPSESVNGLASRVIGAAIEVHRHLGPGFLESVYEGALAHEMDGREIPYVRQARIHVPYKGVFVGEGRIDFLVGGELIVEVKAITQLQAIHEAQVISYLRARHLNLGLLINFNNRTLKSGLKRVVYSRDG